MIILPHNIRNVLGIPGWIPDSPVLFANWYNNGMEVPAEPEEAKKNTGRRSWPMP